MRDGVCGKGVHNRSRKWVYRESLLGEFSLLLKDAPLLVLQRLLNEWHFLKGSVIPSWDSLERERERVCEVRARCEVKICLKSLNEYIEGLLTRTVHFEVDDW
jgi:hypothetical protein